MTNKSDKVLVVFSTLNQITNYIAYKITQPQKVICITYDKNVHEGANIHTTKWNENLLRELKKAELEKEPKIEVVTHSITKGDIEHLENSSFEKTSFFDNIFPNYQEDKQTYFWHITGGQRIFSLKAYEFISKNNRLEQDALFYIEGNHNKLMFIGNNKTHEEEIRKRYNEADFNLTIDTCFRLMGFKEVEGKVLKRHGKAEIKPKEEYKFYNSLIGHIDKEAKSKEDHHFLKKLSESNDAKEKRSELITGYVEEIVNLEPIEEEIAEYCCFNYSYPAGYMFEKLVGYKLFNEIKDNPNIIEMQMGVKIKADGAECRIIDEIDILLLTKYGKLINIECKSGAMSGDNAKSTHYTTYALAGVFGVPILMSPSFSDEIDIKLSKVQSAVNAAKRANLQVVRFDEITEETLNQWF